MPLSSAGDANLARSFGDWGYYSGTSGSVTVAEDERVIGISAHSVDSGSFTVNGGPPIIIPANVSISITPQGNLMSPTIVFTGTDTYFVEVVS